MDESPSELEVFRHARRRSRYHACKAKEKEKQRAKTLIKRPKRDPRPRLKEEELWDE